MFDTNVLIDAACFNRSFGFRAYVTASSLGAIVMSQDTFAELREVMMRPKFDRFVGRDLRRQILTSLQKDAEWLEPWCHYRVCRDPTDDKFIDLAVCAGATAIITRDADLLILHPLNGITVQDPQAFLAAHQQTP